ncbi:divalent-cation tolerance protein CutA [Paracoccus sp. YLB-12]|uniref:Divalent-cation tolerance protein CutA n=1 Tax=Paracoccus maritimus TaxID=2933292 RepID=A0ABT2KCP2_9RHOB|nr:divalent-cation tolerance protein CutA [Paracoccus sp. YLB-12]MCT4333634.1 divalent-cation tolerance protein CutA [Paracoccus sp. YLB-12]
MLHLETTCPDSAVAKDIARAALQRRLAACAQIQPEIVSLFHWQGAIEDETEIRLIFKTHEGRRDALITLIRDMHPYDLPVITWHLVATTPDATEWLLEETR